jgi:hypothetical protein
VTSPARQVDIPREISEEKKRHKNEKHEYENEKGLIRKKKT